MSDLLIDDLRTRIAKEQAIAIVGAGVSVGATNNAPVASWVGLLKHGIAQCEAVGNPRPPTGWGDRQREALESGDLDELLGVAEQVSRRLGYPDAGEWRSWLRETAGSLKTRERSVLEALRDLGIPIATTNYDGLIEEATGWPAVTWRDEAQVERVLRGDDPGVLHLHGHWNAPTSVVLGIRSYDAVLGDAHAQMVLRALRLRHTLIFIGFGAGLGDPNFGALLSWSRPVFVSSEYRHFRLCRSHEQVDIQAKHPPEERIFAVSFGAEHGDLGPFLRALAPKTNGGTKGNGSSGARSTISLPPKPARCIGRDREVEALVGAVLAGEPAPVLGSGGIGKSTVCRQALHDPGVVEQFGTRRYFVRCDGAKTAEDLTAAIGLGLGMEPGAGLIGRITRKLGEAPAAIALDNLETPWEQEPLETEAVLAELAAVPGVALAVTLRGRSRPGGVAWREPIEMQPLRGDDPKRLFLAIAGEKHASDAQLANLLAALDGIPLAIELMAHAAEAEPDLADIWQRWQTERTRMLARGKGRLADLAASLQRSIGSPKMTDLARRLLALMGMLPDGVARGDLDALLPRGGHAAASTLRQLALAFDEAERLRTLAPVREHVAAEHPPTNEDLQGAIAHYASVALDLGRKCGAEGGREAIGRLSVETANIESILLRGLKEDDPTLPIQATVAFAQFQRFTGFGTTMVLKAARDSAKRIGSMQGEANCIHRLGDIALRRSDHEAAREFYQQALPLYQQVRDVRGEANCIKNLGDIALARFDHDGARELYQQALPLYRRVGAVRGEANCIRRLGDIALARSDHDGARELYQQALPLYRRVSAVRGEATCIKRLGDIALARSDRDGARDLYQQAMPLYQRIGDVRGEANCIKSLGDIALARPDPDGARAQYEAALALYARIAEPYSIGWAHAALAQVARDDADRARQLQAAREAWRSIRRDDLMRWLDETFRKE